MGDQAVIDGDHVVRPVAPESGSARAVNGEAYPGPPLQTVDVSCHRLHNDLAVDTTQSVQLFHHDGLLEPPLRLRRRMLPVTAATSTRAGELAAGNDTVGGRVDDGDRVRTQVSVFGPDVGDLDEHTLTRQSVSDEDHLTVAARHAVPTVGDRADDHLEPVTDGPGGCQGFSSSATVASACSGVGSPRRTAPGAKFSGRSS